LKADGEVNRTTRIELYSKAESQRKARGFVSSPPKPHPINPGGGEKMHRQSLQKRSIEETNAVKKGVGGTETKQGV